MVKTIYLIRHGETENSEIKRYKGSIDEPLSEKGLEQIKKVATFMKNIKLSRLYTSPLSRALQSAEIIAEPHGLKPIVLPDIRERSFGLWEGMTFTEIKEKYPLEFEAWANNPLLYNPVGGESTIEVRDRVIRTLQEILKGVEVTTELPSFRTNIAIVAHGGVNRIILCHFMGLPLENIFRIEQDYGAINIIELYDKYPVVKLLNYTV